MRKLKLIPYKTLEKLYKIIPIFNVDAVIKNEKGVLLTRRTIPPMIGYWHLPGGMILKNERVVGALKRKVKEETGLDVRSIKLIGIYDNPKRDPRGHLISLSFLVKVVGGKIRTNKEADDIRFFKKLPKRLGFDTKKILNDVGIR